MKYCRRCSNSTRCAEWRGVRLCRACRRAVAREFDHYRRWAIGLVTPQRKAA